MTQFITQRLVPLLECSILSTPSRPYTIITTIPKLDNFRLTYFAKHVISKLNNLFSVHDESSAYGLKSN